MKRIQRHDIPLGEGTPLLDIIFEKHGHVIDQMDAELANLHLSEKQESGKRHTARTKKTRATHKVKVIVERGSAVHARKCPLPRDPETKAVLVAPDRSQKPKKTDKVVVYRTEQQKRERNQRRQTHRGNACWDQPDNE